MVKSVTFTMYLAAQLGFMVGFILCAILRMGEREG